MMFSNLDDYEGLLVDRICPDCGSHLCIKSASIVGERIKLVVTCMTIGCPSTEAIVMSVDANTMLAAEDKCLALQISLDAIRNPGI